MRPGAGRKPLPPEDRQRNRIMLNLTDREYRDLVAAAAEEPVSSFARRVLRRYVARRRK